MTPTITEARWQGNQRCDGLSVIYDTREDTWTIYPAPMSRMSGILAACPCCCQRFRTADDAQRVADFIYRMSRDD